MTPEEKLIAERKQIEARQERRNAAEKADRKRLEAIAMALMKLQLSKLIGVADGVKVNTRYHADHPNAKFNHAAGTLVKVNRTRALVDFGELGRWTWPVYRLTAAEGRQGVTLEALLAGDMGDAP